MIGFSSCLCCVDRLADVASPSAELMAYIGPGPGIGLIGCLVAVFLVLLIGIIGLVQYPLRLIRRRRQLRKQMAESTSQEVQSTE